MVTAGWPRPMWTPAPQLGPCTQQGWAVTATKFSLWPDTLRVLPKHVGRGDPERWTPAQLPERYLILTTAVLRALL